MTGPLAGKVAFVAGASRGIGRALAVPGGVTREESVEPAAG